MAATAVSTDPDDGEVDSGGACDTVSDASRAGADGSKPCLAASHDAQDNRAMRVASRSQDHGELILAQFRCGLHDDH